jgi:hypothetical protein
MPQIKSKQTTEMFDGGGYETHVTSNVEICEIEKSLEEKGLKTIDEGQEQPPGDAQPLDEASGKSESRKKEKESNENSFQKQITSSGKGTSQGIRTPYSMVSDKSYGQLHHIISESSKKKLMFSKKLKNEVQRFDFPQVEISKNFGIVYSNTNQNNPEKAEKSLNSEQKELEQLRESSISKKTESHEKTMQYIIEARKQREIIKK